MSGSNVSSMFPAVRCTEQNMIRLGRRGCSRGAFRGFGLSESSISLTRLSCLALKINKRTPVIIIIITTTTLLFCARGASIVVEAECARTLAYRRLKPPTKLN